MKYNQNTNSRTTSIKHDQEFCDYKVPHVSLHNYILSGFLSLKDFMQYNCVRKNRTLYNF